MPPDVVISYSFKDQDVANAIYDALVAANVKCWMATKDIDPGANFLRKILEAIINCQIVIFVYSVNAIDSEYAEMEIHTAQSNKKWIIPFKIGEVPKNNIFEMMLSLKERIEAGSPPNDEDIRKLVKAVQKHLASPQMVSGTTTSPKSSVLNSNNDHTGSSSNNRVSTVKNMANGKFVGMLFVFLLIVVAGSYLLFFNHNDPVPTKPNITFIQVPVPGSPDTLKGKVMNVNVTDSKVLVVIFVQGWWNKPSWVEPLTNINDDGTWECKINTDPNDTYTTKIAAFIVPGNYSPQKMMGQQTLPLDVYRHSYANITVNV